MTVPKSEEQVEIIENEYSLMNGKAYQVGGMKGSDEDEIIFSEDLGLAIEKPRAGVTVESLWKII